MNMGACRTECTGADRGAARHSFAQGHGGSLSVERQATSPGTIQPLRRMVAILARRRRDLLDMRGLWWCCAHNRQSIDTSSRDASIA
jgi:hypothetical protein